MCGSGGRQSNVRCHFKIRLVMNSSIVIWSLIGTSFGIYFLISLLYKTLRIHNLHQALPKLKGLGLLNLKHLVGVGVFGVVFYMACPDLRYLLVEIEVPRLQVLIPFFMVVLLSVSISIKSAKSVQGDNFDFGQRHHSAVVMFFIVRLLFLLSYEFFFRGVLFYEFLKFNGLYVSILYTTLFYVVIHIFDSKKEILGAIPFGIVLCLFTYYANSVWPAFIIHAALSLAYEISLINNLTLKPQKS